MKEKLLLAGAGDFGRVVLEHASLEYDFAFVDDGKKKENLVTGVPMLGTMEELSELFPKYQKLVVTIGNNTLREKVYLRAAQIGYTFPNIVAASAYISPYSKIGTGCVILNNVVVQNNAVFEMDGVILNQGVEIHHDSVVEDYVLIYTNSVVRSLSRVCSRAHIGGTLTISNEVIVPEDAVIENGRSCYMVKKK